MNEEEQHITLTVSRGCDETTPHTKEDTMKHTRLQLAIASMAATAPQSVSGFVRDLAVSVDYPERYARQQGRIVSAIQHLRLAGVEVDEFVAALHD